MNKADLIRTLQKKNQFLLENDIKDSVSLLLNNISDSLANGNRIELRGFGSFSARKREKRTSRNPKTGSSISVQMKYHPYFRASKALKAAINK